MLSINYLELFKNIPPELATLIVSMLPVSELRGAIPLAITGYKMNPWIAYFIAVLGNCLPPIFFILFLEKISSFLSKKFIFWKKFFNWLFERTRRKAEDKIKKYGNWGLFLLVAVPLPMTGGWTGALATFLFGIDKKKSIPTIILGIMTAGIIVLILTVGVTKIF